MRARLLATVACCAVLFAAERAHAQPGLIGAPAPADGAAVAIERFAIRYGLAHPELPAIAELDAITIPLVRSGSTWRADGAGEPAQLVLGSIPAGSLFDVTALRRAAETIVTWFNARGIHGVWVAFEGFEASSAGLVDLRAATANGAADLVIWASQVAEVRTLARGERFTPEVANNHRRHAWIARESPLHPARAGGEPGTLFRKDVLEAYLRSLSTHPGRRVEGSIASAGEPGKVVLDYLVNEARPWHVFGQVSNTGTTATDRWRTRLGFQHTQLTNRDDILNVDLVSTPDLDTYAGFVSYRLPIVRPQRLLARIYGSYGDFLADGVGLENLRFAGKNWLAGLELSRRFPLGRSGWDIVANAGVNHPHYEIQSRIGAAAIATGSSDFLIPFAGATLARETDAWSLNTGLRVEHTIDGFANTDPSTGIPALGRLGAEEDWTSLRWSLAGSAYLEPLVFARGRGATSLAHEVSLRVRGRTLVRGERLIPQEQDPMGGALSVRGYPESIVAADESIVATVEYAFHLPRALKAGEPGRFLGKTFRWRPPRAQRRPDWDLIVRAFFDYGWRGVSRPDLSESGAIEVGDDPLVEKSVSLAGAGGGLELVIRQNLSIRCDVGTALRQLRDRSRPPGEQIVVGAGDMEAHIVTAFSW